MYKPGITGVTELMIRAILDSPEDLDTLGTTWAPGSTATVADVGGTEFILNASYQWKNVSSVTVYNSFTITLGTGLTYTGSEQTQTVTKVEYGETELVADTDYVLMSNTATVAGTYSLMVVGIGKYAGCNFADFVISKQALTKPTISDGTLVYDGTTQTLLLTGFAAETMSIVGNTGTDTGTYTATISLKDSANYEWADHSITDIELEWTIEKAALTKPTISDNTLVYDTTTQTIELANFDTDTMSIVGNTGTDTGTYTATISLKDSAHYEWADHSITPLELSWTIEKADVIVTLDKYTIALGALGLETITVTADNPAYTASIVGTAATMYDDGDGTLTITAAETGVATVTVYTEATSNYNASEEVECVITVS